MAEAVFGYPVNETHSTVLGYSAKSKHGKHLWDELDWRGVLEDRGEHLFNPAGGSYLHVRCKYDSQHDGPKPCPVSNRRWYRVRCSHEIGSSWRGGVVKNVTVERRNNQWWWVVHVVR